MLVLVNPLIERWRPEIHIFHFPVSECVVTLEDVVIILCLPTNGLPVTGPTLTSYEALEAECLDQFGVGHRKIDCRGSFIKLTWFRGLKYRLVLADDIHIRRVTCIDCKEIDGLLTLFLTWAWICLPFFVPILGNPRLFPIANRWRNQERADWPYRFRSLVHLRRALDDLQEGHVYAIGRIDPDVILFDIRQHSIIWSVTIPLISFECIEWHASDRLRRQFGFTQGVPHQERDLGEAYGEVQTGAQNHDWFGTHSFLVMHWTNRYSRVLVEHLVPSQHPLDIYMHWYRGTYGAHLHLSDLILQENQEGNSIYNQKNQQDQPPPPPLPPQLPPPPPQTQAQQEPEQFTPYILDMHYADYFTPSSYYINSIGMSRIKNQGNMIRLANCLDSWLLCQVTHYHVITETFPPTRGRTRVEVDDEANDYLVDYSDEDEDEDKDEDANDANDDDDDDPDDGPAPSGGTTTSEKGK
ncbi:Serine/threonine protein phosphatase 7 long form isogeny [Arachis hypogaea]|nr:Serine/threonine protein phosphatase 7 long form isogeny [Arachis hypogaea]